MGSVPSLPPLLLLLLLGTACSAPQHRLLFSPSRQSSTVRPLFSGGSPAAGVSGEVTSLSAGTDPGLASSGRLILTPERLIFSASRRSGPSQSLFAAVPPPAAGGRMARLQTLLPQAAGRSRQAQRAAAARQDLTRSGPRPRLGPRTPEAVAANPETPTAPRDGVTRGAVKAGTGDPLADHTAAADGKRLDARSEGSDWASNLLDSAAQAGLRSPGQALDGPDTPEGNRLWPTVPTGDGRIRHAGPEEAEDWVYDGAMRSEGQLYPGPARSGVPVSSDSPRPIAASAAELQQFGYLAELVRLGGDFVYLPGLGGLPAGPGGGAQTADTGLPRRPPQKAASPVYVYIVRRDGQTLDLYATDGQPPARTGGDDATPVPLRAAAVLERGPGRKANQEPNDTMPVNQNRIGGVTTGLNSAADNLTNLLRVVGETQHLNTAMSRGPSADSAARKSRLPAQNGTEHTTTKEKFKDPNSSVYFDPVDELIPRSEAKSKPSVENDSANIAIERKQDHGVAVDELLQIAEDRGIFFFPGDVIHSFGIAPSATGEPVVVSAPRPGVPSRLSSANQSTPISELLTPPGHSLVALAAGTRRQDTVLPAPSPPPPTAVPVTPVTASKPPAVLFTEDTPSASPPAALTGPQLVFPSSRPPSPVSGGSRFRFPGSAGATPRPPLVPSGRPERGGPAVPEAGLCRPEPDCAALSRRRRGCSAGADCPPPQRCCFSQCLGVSVCQEGTFRDRVAGLSALAKVLVP